MSSSGLLLRQAPALARARPRGATLRIWFCGFGAPLHAPRAAKPCLFGKADRQVARHLWRTERRSGSSDIVGFHSANEPTPLQPAIRMDPMPAEGLPLPHAKRTDSGDVVVAVAH